MMAGMHFYKPMINDKFSERMRLPDKFVNCCGKKLSKDIDLKGPSGNIWHVELAKTMKGTFFHTGWKEFVKDHQIEKTDLLFFTYVGNACFDIVIFDKSSCVKVTSYYAECRSSPRSNGDGLQGNSSRNRLEKTRSKNQCEPEAVDMHNSKGFKLSNVFISRKTRLTDEEEKRIVQLARAVQLKNPYFVTIMHPSMIQRSAFVTVPSGFKATYFPFQSCLISLEVPGFRKKWTVKFSSNRNVNRVCGGWKGFVDDHNLEVGDICLFELTSRRKTNVMTVRIGRTPEHDK